MEMYKEEFEDAVAYAAKEIGNYRINEVVSKMERFRCPASLVDDTIDEAKTLMNEFAVDHDLPENFWDGTYDDDDIMYSLLSI